jgi:hypothetical protein
MAVTKDAGGVLAADIPDSLTPIADVAQVCIECVDGFEGGGGEG